MAFKVTSILEATRAQGIKVLVHGPAGAGKTVLCATTGAPDKTLILSAEAGLLSLRKMVQTAPELEAVTVATISSIDDLREAYRHLKAGGHPFTWVCLDSISEIAEQVLNHEKSKTKDGRAAYGALNDTMLELLRAFRDLPMNVYMSAKQEREQDEDTGRTLYSPSLPGKRLSQGISYLFDEVFALRIDKDEQGPYRVLVCKPDGRFEAKDRSGQLAALEVPNLAEIHNKIMGA
jgi:phage nucleotide-binding protein